MTGGEIAILAGLGGAGAVGLFVSGFLFGSRHAARKVGRLHCEWAAGRLSGPIAETLDRLEWAGREVREWKAAERRREAETPDVVKVTLPADLFEVRGSASAGAKR